jgi:signal recognition particle receptor subunit beta
MVFFNYATMQMAAKIVYYGPGLCGKTTNLHHIYQKTAPQSRGEMVSLETETDRTLFFDLLPIDVGVIAGFKTRLQLYTVPGQVFYNTTRKLVLKGVDGIVFVADSQLAMLDANADSFRNLQENLAEIDLKVEDVPLVIQLNKRDLPNIASVDAMLDRLDPERKFEHAEAIAASGVGVFETLKTISKLTIRTLRRRMTQDEPAKPLPRKTISDVAQFRVAGETPQDPGRTIAGGIALPDDLLPPATTPEPAVIAETSAAQSPSAAATAVETLAAPEEPQSAPFGDETIAAPSMSLGSVAPAEEESPFDAPAATEETSEVEEVAEIAAAPEPAPAIEEEPQPEPAVAAAVSAPEPELVIPEAEKPSKSAPEVKHVKVRTNVDVMAELEALRRKATTPRTAKKEPEIAIPAPRRDSQKSLQMSVAADAVAQAKTLRVTVSFEGDDGVAVTEERSLELDGVTNVQTLSVNLKIDLA